MHRRWSGTLVVLASLAPAFAPATPLAAQEHDDGPMRVYSFTAGRPRIGVTVDMRAGRDNDKLGATVKEVTDDGPADKAGLKAGDIITRFHGVSLAGASGDDEGGPGARLVELAGKLEPGDTVDVEYRRGGDSRKAKIIAADLGGVNLARGFQVIDAIGAIPTDIPPVDPNMRAIDARDFTGRGVEGGVGWGVVGGKGPADQPPAEIAERIEQTESERITRALLASGVGRQASA